MAMTVSKAYRFCELRVGLTARTGLDLTKAMNLTDFSALKRICIRVDFLVEPSLYYEHEDFIWKPSVMPTHCLINRLSPALEEIRLNSSGMLYNYRSEKDEHESRVQALLSWLLDVAASKPAAIPALNRVGYAPSWFYGTDDGRHDARYEEVKDIYKKAGIDLYGYDE